MPWSRERKHETRTRILDAAARCFTRKGYDAVSIDEVMAAAGLTRGAFYAHFDSKSTLYANAIRHAARRGAIALDHLESREARIEAYLSQSLAKDEATCPLACLVSDVAQRDEQVRTTYTALLEGFLTRFVDTSDMDTDTRKRALGQTIAMIGSLAMARTVNDPRLAEELLEAGRTLAKASTLPVSRSGGAAQDA